MHLIRVIQPSFFDIEDLIDVRVVVAVKFAHVSFIGPFLVEDSSPSDFHLVFASPSFELLIFIDEPSSNTETVSFLETSILDVILVSFSYLSDKLDVVDLRSSSIRQSFSNKMNFIFAVSSVENKFLVMDFVVIKNGFSIENNSKSVAILIPKSLFGSMVKS